MAMPYMEQAEDPTKFYQDIVKRVKQYPNGIKKTVFELQATNWRTNKPVPSQEMADTIRSLYQQGAMHVGITQMIRLKIIQTPKPCTTYLRLNRPS